MYEVQGTLTCPPTPPHPTPPQPTPPHPISSVATCNVVNDPRDLSSVAIFHARSTRNVNISPPTPPHNRDIQKRAFYGNGFRSAGKNIYNIHETPLDSDHALVVADMHVRFASKNKRQNATQAVPKFRKPTEEQRLRYNLLVQKNWKWKKELHMECVEFFWVIS